MLRLAVGEQLLCFYKNNSYQCEVLSICDQKICCQILGPIHIEQNPFHLTIYLAINKPKIWDLMVAKLTELGVNKIVPFYCARTQAH